jgi:hypothetical protein
MKDPRLAYVPHVAGAVALLVFSLMVYVGFLTSAWGTLIACIPAVVVTIGVVGGMACGVLLFGSEEDETPQEAGRLDGVALFDRLGACIEELVHRVAIRLHVRGVGP